MLQAGIRLVVGLGNPGADYDATRHNAGFWFVEELAGSERGAFKNDSRYKAKVLKLAQHNAFLLMPQTFMNRSGQSIRALSQFYKIPPEQILVVHDELDLPPGSVKLKKGGGHGGHNGLRDTIAQLGSKDFLRLRLGIGHPGHRDQVVNYVLHKPGKDERQQIDDAIWRALRIMPELWQGQLEQAMQSLHTV